MLIVTFVMVRPPLQNCLDYLAANPVVAIWAPSEGRKTTLLDNQEEIRNAGHRPSWEACVEWHRGRRPTQLTKTKHTRVHPVVRVKRVF